VMHDVSCALQQAIGEIFAWRMRHLRISRSGAAERQNEVIPGVISQFVERTGRVRQRCRTMQRVPFDHLRPFAIGDSCEAAYFGARWRQS
jgi:hypothetical protein